MLTFPDLLSFSVDSRPSRNENTGLDRTEDNGDLDTRAEINTLMHQSGNSKVAAVSVKDAVRDKTKANSTLYKHVSARTAQWLS